MKKILLYSMLLVATVTQAQSNEYFEDETVGVSTFTTDGQGFTMTGGMTIDKFDGYGVDGAYPASETGVSNRFTQISGTNKTVSIKTTDAKVMNVLELYFYVTSNSSGDIAPVSGSISFTGKLAGVDKFTITKASPTFSFPTGYSVYNGFSKIDLSAEAMASSINIDELTVVYSGNIAFFNIDNFRWKVANLSATEFKRDLFSVSPNPASNQVTVSMADGVTSEGTYTLRDINGKSLQTGKLQDVANVVSLSSYAKGIYLLEVTTNEGSSVRKLVKK